MTRNLKVLGLALVASLALSAMAASAAQATFSFTAASQPTTLTGTVDGTSNDVFTTSEGTVECNSILFTGTSVETTSSDQKIEPHYSECTAFGFTAHINATPCYYTFTTPTAGSPGARTGEPPHVKCPNGGGITITPTFFGSSICTSTIGEQTPTGGHIIYKNVETAGGKKYITVETTVTGVHYIGTGSVCGPSGVTSTDGTYNGKETLKAYKDPSTHNEANQVNISVS